MTIPTDSRPHKTSTHDPRADKTPTPTPSRTPQEPAGGFPEVLNLLRQILRALRPDQTAPLAAIQAALETLNLAPGQREALTTILQHHLGYHDAPIGQREALATRPQPHLGQHDARTTTPQRPLR